MGIEQDEFSEWKRDVDEERKKFREALFGNGKPGMDEEIRNIKTMLDVLIKLAWIVTTAVVTTGVAGIIGAGIYLIKVTH